MEHNSSSSNGYNLILSHICIIFFNETNFSAAKKVPYQENETGTGFQPTSINMILSQNDHILLKYKRSHKTLSTNSATTGNNYSTVNGFLLVSTIASCSEVKSRHSVQ